MAAGEIHVGDVGLRFTTQVVDETGAVVDVSQASSLLMYLTRPDGTTIVGTASPVSTGTDGNIYYATQAGDLTIPGTWRVQSYTAIGPNINWGDITKFKVFANLG